MNFKIKHGVNQRIKSVNPKYYSSSYLSRWSKKIFSALIPGELKSPKPPPKTIKKAGTVSFAQNPNIATKNSSKIMSVFCILLHRSTPNPTGVLKMSTMQAQRSLSNILKLRPV